MPKINDEIIQVDDLTVGRTYRFELRNRLITGLFDGFINKGRGQPLLVIVSQDRATILFPLVELLEIRYEAGGLIGCLELGF